MPWTESVRMEERERFVRDALSDRYTMSARCARYGVSRRLGSVWLARYEAGGVFFARLVPVVRHLIGIPAGLVRMSFGLYSAMTIVGAGLWCWVLAWFGGNLLGDQPELINDPSLLVQVLRQRSWLFGGFALLLCALYVLVMKLTAKPAPSNS